MKRLIGSSSFATLLQNALGIEVTEGIEILDADGNVVDRIQTNNPEQSFDQYCRNRVTIGYTWRQI